jgi:hypothetical protein
MAVPMNLNGTVGQEENTKIDYDLHPEIKVPLRPVSEDSGTLF